MRDLRRCAEAVTTKAVPLCLLVIALALPAACSQKTLVAVAACPDAGGGAPSCTSLRMGLVGLWRLDDMTGTTAFDASGLAMPNHGVVKDLDPTTAWVEGQIGGALETKATGYVLVPRSPTIDAIKGQVSVAAWVYLEGAIVDYGTAISRQIGTGLDQYYHLGLDSLARPHGFIIRSVPDPFVRALVAPMPVLNMTWTHMALTYDGLNARLYVDGKEVDAKPITGTFGDDTTPLIIGANGNKAIVDERFPGRIDEIALYDRALTPAEVSQLASGYVF